MVDLPETVIKNLTSCLQLISFGPKSMTKWPKNNNFLINIFSIDLNDVQYPEQPEDTFSTLKNNLVLLNLYNTGPTKLPSSRNDCQNMSSMIFRGNKKLSANSITKSITRGFSFLTSITFQDNGLTTLPSIFLKSTRIGRTVVRDNPIVYLRDDAFPLHLS